MAFAAERLDRALIARIKLDGVWEGLDDLSERGACDAGSVRQRLALYRLLVERTNPRGAWGRSHELSPFWGYASQLCWQHKSGRLSPEGARSDAIDPASWWGACNYALCVVPYRAAAAEGLVPQLRFEEGSFRAPAYDAVDVLWRRVVRRIHGLSPGEDPEPVRFAIWAAHLESIRVATRAHAALQGPMNGAERRLAEGWVRMVDFFCAAALRTDLVMLAEHGTGNLPSRLLADKEHFADLPPAERETIRRVFSLADQSPVRWSVSLSAWARIMRSAEARKDVVRVLDGIFGRGLSALPGRGLALAYAALPRSAIRVLRR